MSSYQTVTLVTASPPPSCQSSSLLSCVGTQFCWHTTQHWPGISNINPLFDYLRGQLGPGEVVSLTPYITGRGRLSNRQLASNKTSQAQRIVITARSDVMVVLMCDTRHMVTMQCDQYRISDVTLIPPTLFMQSGADPAQEAHSLSGDISSL